MLLPRTESPAATWCRTSINQGSKPCFSLDKQTRYSYEYVAVPFKNPPPPAADDAATEVLPPRAEWNIKHKPAFCSMKKQTVRYPQTDEVLCFVILNAPSKSVSLESKSPAAASAFFFSPRLKCIYIQNPFCEWSHQPKQYLLIAIPLRPPHPVAPIS